MMRRISGAAVANLFLVLVLSSGCADNTETAPDGGSNNNCAPGLRPMGPACVPIFDECRDDEVPMLGGGCKRVGVKECLDGWGLMGPPDWKCKPIGPPRTCLKGWEKVAGGWCEPILPKTKCPVGTMEKIGFSTCQPIGDCGTGTWGNIMADAKTIFVDQNHKGTSGLGTVNQPYLTIEEAMTYASVDANIAVAAGDYEEDLYINRPITIAGRCAQKVSLYFSTSDTIDIDAKGVKLSSMTISSKMSGIVLWKNSSAVLQGVVVRNCGKEGILADVGSHFTMRDSLVEGNSGVGIGLLGAIMDLERTVVRDGRPSALGSVGGAGIVASTKLNTSPKVTIRGCLFDNNRRHGISLWGAEATLERTVIVDTQPQALDQVAGVGIQAAREDKISSSLTMRDCFVGRNRQLGIGVWGSKATVERTVVRDTHEQASDKVAGAGIAVMFLSNQSHPSDVTVRDSLVVGNRVAGILLESSKATVERTVVRDTRERALDNTLGFGIEAWIQAGQSRPAEVTVRDSLITGNRYMGLGLFSSKATVERTVVRDTREQASDKHYGGGIQASIQNSHTQPSELTVGDSLVTGNRSFGILVESSKATIERSVVRDTRGSALDDNHGMGIQASVRFGNNLPSELTVRDSLVSRNRSTGVLLESSKAIMERTVVRDTGEQASDGMFGTGIQASMDSDINLPSELTVRESLVAGNRSTGIFIWSSKATVERTVVRDTRESASHNMFGRGIEASIQSGQSRLSELTVRESLVSRNRSTGIALFGANGKLELCAVSDTKTDGYHKYGDGIVTRGETTLDVKGLLVERSARAGFLFIRSGGSVHRSLIRRNVFAIDLEDGAAPFISDDNQMVDNQINRVTLGQGLTASPMPSVPNLGGPDSGLDSGPDAGVRAQ